MSLPASIWGNVIFPFLGIHAVLHLKSLNKYSLRLFPRLFELYRQVAWQNHEIYGKAEILDEVRTAFQDAYQFLTSHMDRKSIVEIRTFENPPQGVKASIEVWCMLLSGTKPTHPVQAFRQHFNNLTPLANVRKIPDVELVRVFMNSYTETELMRMSLGCAVFYKYLERMVKAEELRTPGYEEMEEKAEYWGRENAICEKIARGISA